MLKTGDLVYVPSEVVLLQFNEDITYIDPEKTYVGPSPIKIHQLKKPTNLLLTSCSLMDKKYLKVLFNGDEWYVDKKDINET